MEESPKSKNELDKARLAEQLERFEDMAQAMKDIIDSSGSSVELNSEGRNLLSVAYKNVVGSRRAALRLFTSIEDKEKREGGDVEKIDVIQEYKRTVQTELDKYCNEVLALIEKLVKSDKDVKAVKDDESKVFYYKMKGDYYRYLAEFSPDDEKKKAAEEAYQQALTTAENTLNPIHPIRLGLALNLSVFYYEILEDQDKACEFAKKAFEDAMDHSDAVEEASYKDSTLIMQLLRDNLTLWNASRDLDSEGDTGKEGNKDGDD